jgi:hypothetical protein
MLRAHNFATFMCGNPGNSTSWDPQGLSKPVQEFIYLIITNQLLSLGKGVWECS